MYYLTLLVFVAITGAADHHSCSQTHITLDCLKPTDVIGYNDLVGEIAFPTRCFTFWDLFPGCLVTGLGWANCQARCMPEGLMEAGNKICNEIYAAVCGSDCWAS